jgi:primary-amine oxidase
MTLRLAVVLLAFCLPLHAAGSDLSPVTSADASTAVQLIKADSRMPADAVFMFIGPRDPIKYLRLDAERADHPRFLVILRDTRSRNIHEVTVEPSMRRIVEWTRLDDKQPPIMATDIERAEKIVRAHEGWRTSLRRRGIDSSRVDLVVWPSTIPYAAFRFRSVRVLTYLREADGSQQYLRPVDGLVVTVNTDAQRAFEFYDKDVAPQPPSHPTKEDIASRRRKMMAVTSNARSTSNIKMKGATVEWGPWQFVPAVHPREGLVLHHVDLGSGTRRDRLAHRLSVGETVMLYHDSTQYWSWRFPLLHAELGLGCHVNDQRKGKDVPSAVKFVATATVEPDGKVRTVPGAVALFEKDDALIVQSSFTIYHLDVRQQYVLGVDGRLTIDVWVGGVPLARSTFDTVATDDNGSQGAIGTLVRPQIFVPFMQFASCFRLDLDVADTANTLAEVEWMHGTGPISPYSSTIVRDVYPFSHESEAQRSAMTDGRRTWLVSATGSTHEQGVSIRPGTNAQPLLRSEHAARSKSGFLDHTVWTTRYRDAELLPLSPYANQSNGESTLRSYVANNDHILKRDLVVWCVQGALVEVSEEEWPVMRGRHASVTLVPKGYLK